MPSFYDLPPEIQLLICNHLSALDVIKLNGVSCYTHTLTNDNFSWRDRLERNFPHIFNKLIETYKDTDYKELFKVLYKIEYSGLTQRQRSLFSFVKDGDAESLKKFVIRKEDLLKANDKNGLNLLDWAIKNKRQPILNHFFELVLKSHTSQVSAPNKSDKFGYYLLHWAILCNQPSYVQTLLFIGATPKVTLGNMRFQPLHLAAKQGQLDIIKAIVESDPSTLDEQDAKGQTAFLWACANGHAKVVAYLLTKNPNIEVATISSGKHNGWTALHWAAAHGHEQICCDLLRVGMIPDCLTACNKTPADIAKTKRLKRLLSLDEYIVRLENEKENKSFFKTSFSLFGKKIKFSIREKLNAALVLKASTLVEPKNPDDIAKYEGALKNLDDRV